jgi:hypothetical protein
MAALNGIELQMNINVDCPIKESCPHANSVRGALQSRLDAAIKILDGIKHGAFVKSPEPELRAALTSELSPAPAPDTTATCRDCGLQREHARADELQKRINRAVEELEAGLNSAYVRNILVGNE